MGQGSIVLFNAFSNTFGTGVFNFASGGNDFDVRLITDAVVAAKTDAAPVKGDYTECSGGTYILQELANIDFTQVVTLSNFVADSVTFNQDAVSGPQDCYQALLVDHDSPFEGIGFWDLTTDGGVTPLSLRDAPIVLNFGTGTRRIFYASIPANV